MLKAHMDAVERQLLTTASVPANSGHSLHKGTPRESFIRQFLESHLSSRSAIGSGEIIDCNSKPGDSRNQLDIVIYKGDYPRLDFGGGINGFLVESVVATIEVKSTLTKTDLTQATKAARNIKLLQPNVITSFSAGYIPPSILSFVVAYDGPASMETVHGWLPEVNVAADVTYPQLPRDDNARLKMASPAIDAVIVLGKGFMHFGNTPMGFFQPQVLEKDPDYKWVYSNTPSGSLQLLFMLLTSAVSNMSGTWLNPRPYLATFSVPGVTIDR
jgi:hypothetical protein